MPRRSAILTVIAIGMIITAAAVVMPNRPKPVTRLLTVLITPAPGVDGHVEARASERVKVIFDIENTGTVTVGNLAVGVSCQCHIKSGPLPKELAPGQSTRVTVELSAPAAGVARREVPITSQSTGELLATLVVPFRVPVNAPSWLDGPRAATFTFVAGQPARGELLWEAIEDLTAPRWIEGATMMPAEIANVSVDMEQRPWGEEGRYCLRRYRMRLELERPTVGKWNGNLVIAYHESERREASVLVSVEVLPTMSVIPSSVMLRGTSNLLTASTTKVFLINRSGDSPIVTPRFDESLLKVINLESEGGDSRSFRVISVGTVREPLQTEVVFMADGVESTILKVNLVEK